jgi:hypothetical protein
MFEHVNECARDGLARGSRYMADDDAATERNRNDEPSPEPVTPPDPQMDVHIQFVNSLPGGRAVMPVEEAGKFIWLVVHGHISPQAASEMETDLSHIIRSGLWRQNWQPPQPD